MNFEHSFRSLERLWEAVAPDPSLYPHRHQYNWLCGIYVAHRRRQGGSKGTYGELSAKTRQLIQENTTFIDIAESCRSSRSIRITSPSWMNCPHRLTRRLHSRQL